MTADKRSVHTDALAWLGKQLIPENVGRDAIHLAVDNVVAGMALDPADHIRIVGGEAFKCVPGDGTKNLEENYGHGIVDPFLLRRVQKGERFLLVIYPRVITSLRHVWAHPTLPDREGQAGDKAVSEAWLRQYACRVNPYYVEDLGSGEEGKERAYQSLMEGIRSGQLVYHGIDMHSQGDLIDADELRHHASVVLGRQVIWEEFDYFSCTC